MRMAIVEVESRTLGFHCALVCRLWIESEILWRDLLHDRTKLKKVVCERGAQDE